MAVACQADYLTRAEQGIPHDWFKIPFLGMPKLLLGLGLVTGRLA